MFEVKTRDCSDGRPAVDRLLHQQELSTLSSDQNSEVVSIIDVPEKQFRLREKVNKGAKFNPGKAKEGQPIPRYRHKLEERTAMVRSACAFADMSSLKEFCDDVSCHEKWSTLPPDWKAAFNKAGQGHGLSPTGIDVVPNAWVISCVFLQFCVH